MNDLLFAVNAVLPMLILIMIGYALKKFKLFNDSLTKGINRINFVVGLPVLLFYSLYNLDSFKIDINIIVYLTIMIFILFFLGWGIVHFYRTKKNRKGLLLQSMFRSNATTIGIQVALSLGITARASANVIALTGLAIGMFNVLGVIAFQLYDDDSVKINPINLIVKIFTNPTVIAVILGFLILGIRPMIGDVLVIKDYLPPLYRVLGQIAGLAAPLALITMGGSFSFSSIKNQIKDISLGIFFRSFFAPFLVLGVALLFKTSLGFDENHFPAIISIMFPSLTVAVVPMSEYMNGDSKFAGQLVVWTTIFSTITMFLAILFLKSLGLV